MKARYHILTTVPFIITYINNPSFFLPFFIGAVLIDFDHCVDFFLRFRRPTFSITELSESLALKPNFIIPLHSFEFAMLVSVLSLLTQNGTINAFTCGYMVHMFFDLNTNGYPSWSSLSLTYRIVKWGKKVCSNTD